MHIFFSFFFVTRYSYGASSGMLRKRSITEQEVIQNCCRAKNVGSLIDRAREPLLGSAVLPAPVPSVASFFEASSEVNECNLRPPGSIMDQYVLGLNVAVHPSLAVQSFESIQQLNHNLQGKTKTLGGAGSLFALLISHADHARTTRGALAGAF